ncbi:hypothetical protein RRG08_048463 [Elysia crispata]|uniref:Uncharacterized protein n=1 Tax=Elysia crispata TaxID=231223 RepID=A0AAE1BAL4_9GAST|nr:hypothetical protein RRG08_048463 [Elysia crispata]
MTCHLNLVLLNPQRNTANSISMTASSLIPVLKQYLRKVLSGTLVVSRESPRVHQVQTRGCKPMIEASRTAWSKTSIKSGTCVRQFVVGLSGRCCPKIWVV